MVVAFLPQWLQDTRPKGSPSSLCSIYRAGVCRWLDLLGNGLNAPIVFHRFLVPIKPASPPVAKVNLITEFATACDAQVIFVAVAERTLAALAGRSAAYILDMMRERKELAEATLRWALQETEGSGVKAFSMLKEGSVVHEVLEAAKESRCDLIVLHHFKAGIAALVLGSTGVSIVGASPVPVLVLPP